MKISILRISTMVLVALLAVLLSACPPPAPGPDGGGNGGMDNGNGGMDNGNGGMDNGNGGMDNGNGGEAPNVTDAAGLKQGVWKEVTGSTTEQGSYVDGKKHGLWKVYLSSGRLFQSKNYVNGDLRRLIFYSHTDPSQPTLDQAMENGILMGPFKAWTYDRVQQDYVLSQSGEYTEGKRTGAWTEVYYTSGVLEETNSGSYTDGHRTGNWDVLDAVTEMLVRHTCTPPTDGSDPPENPVRVTDDSTCMPSSGT